MYQGFYLEIVFLISFFILIWIGINIVGFSIACVVYSFCILKLPKVNKMRLVNRV